LRLARRTRPLLAGVQAVLEGNDRDMRCLVSGCGSFESRRTNLIRVSYVKVFIRFRKILSSRPRNPFQSDPLSFQVTFPNGVFSGTIISSIIHDGDIKRTAEFQLLLGAIALPGVFVGALLCNPFGRRNTVSSL